MSTKRVLFYSHDTFGLGHIRRTQKLANEIAGDGTSILIVCASPKASSYSSSSGIEYLNLPGFTKLISGQYAPRSLNIPIDGFVNLRASLILSAARAFEPDVFIVDKEPLGVKRELLPALEYLRYRTKKCRIVCGFRDILDGKDEVLDEWSKRDTAESLRRFFDDVLIYGSRDVYDFAREYALPEDLADRLKYLGYLHPEENINRAPDVGNKAPSGELPLVTVTLGGGGDGDEILTLLAEMVEPRGRLPFRLFILAGPFADLALVARLKEIEKQRDDLRVSTFVSDSFSVFEQSNLVVSMGGYNTMTELATMGKYALILPRTRPRREQLIRAEVFKKMGLCDFLIPEDASPDLLFDKINAMLEAGKMTKAFSADGLQKFKTYFESISV